MVEEHKKQLSYTDEQLLESVHLNYKTAGRQQAIEILRHRQAERGVKASRRLGNKVWWLNLVLTVATVVIAVAAVFRLFNPGTPVP